MEEALSKSNTLENLDLFNRRLTNFPPAILDFKSLEKLTLRTCNIGRLPDEFGSLSLLKQLDVGQTGLTNLTPAIGQLKQLTHLWLNDNPLPALPPEISVLSSLVYLNADRTFLSQLPEEIGALPNLRCLRLNHNRLTAMPADMSGLAKNLEILYLIGNPIPETEQQRIKAALPGCKVLFQPGRPERK